MPISWYHLLSLERGNFVEITENLDILFRVGYTYLYWYTDTPHGIDVNIPYTLRFIKTGWSIHPSIDKANILIMSCRAFGAKLLSRTKLDFIFIWKISGKYQWKWNRTTACFAQDNAFKCYLYNSYFVCCLGTNVLPWPQRLSDPFDKEDIY